MFRLSANTGFLWKDLPFLDRIRQAAAHGFDAIEFHDEVQSEDRGAVKDVLAETGLPVVGLNTRAGDSAGVAAISGSSDQARRDIEHAVDAAELVGAANIHVLAGVTSDPGARRAYVETLRFALAATDLTILIEPICAEQIPGYHLRTIAQAADVLAEIDNPRLKIMFDCYHIYREHGDVAQAFEDHAQHIGHVQIASVPDRAEPFPGELDYRTLFPAFRAAGYGGAFGCEYRPRGRTQDGLAWREQVLPPLSS